MTLFFNILFSPNKQNVVGALLYVFLFIFIFVEHHYYRKKKKNKGFSNFPFETGPIITFNYFNVLVPCAMLFHFTCMSNEV